ncbi:protein of unknown function [Pseudomonas sp. JV551A1]|uniref:Uncharacterized protein n=1 Tax=Pseudomonas inefficax TaxID=2078786 RepID=A0AAQ1PCU0_9PSED|nr:protein of unknown function [Pseudomonas sp. JV551A1]SPO63250.1 protein of unknown function [Pseudomonas inefficax]
MIGVNGARGRAREAGAGLTCVKFQRFFGLFLGFFFLAVFNGRACSKALRISFRRFSLRSWTRLARSASKSMRLSWLMGGLDDQLRLA